MSESDELNKALATYHEWADTRPELVARLSGGSTNESYLLEADGHKLVMRLNTKATSLFGLDREAELIAMTNAADLAPAVIYCSNEFLVTEYLQGRHWTKDEVSNSARSVRLAALIKAIHALPRTQYVLDIVDRCNHYWAAIETLAVEVPRDLSHLRSRLERKISSWQLPAEQLRPCHNDLVLDNIIDTAEGLKLIDWEYAAMGDPYFDLAVLIEYSNLSASASRALVANYTEVPDQSRLSQNRLTFKYVDILWQLIHAAARHKTPNVAKKLALLAKHLEEV